MKDVGERSIKVISWEAREKVIAMLTTSFVTCPMLRWLYPEPERYFRYFSGFIEYYCTDAYTPRSGVYLTDSIQEQGALLWLTDPAQRDEKRLMKFLLDSVPEQRRSETEEVFEELGKYHPHGPFRMFTIFGVDPMHQGSGRGGQLFQHAMALCDKDKQIGYLEASSTDSKRFYERHGFQALDEVQVGSVPPFFPMVRHFH